MKRWTVVLLAGALLLGACEDEEEEIKEQSIQLASHDYGCMGHDGCDGGYDGGYDSGYEDDYEEDGDRRKETCFMFCDNIIQIPDLPGMGGGREPGEPRSADA